MADIDVAEFLEDTQQDHTGDTTYTDALSVASTNFESNGKYLLWMTARVDDDNTGGLFGWIMNEDTVGVITHSELVGNDQRHYEWWGIYDAPATPVAVAFQHKTVTSTDQVSSDSMALVKMRLDDDLVENTDWRFNENTVLSGNQEQLFVTYAAIPSFTPGTPADSRVILALIRVQNNSTNRSYQWHLEENVNGAGFVEIGGEMILEGEHADEERMHVIAWEDDSGTAGTREYRIQMRNEDTAVNSQHIYSSIFVLEKNAFASEDSDKLTSALDGTDAVQVLNAIADYTPAATGDQIVLTFSNTDANSNNRDWGKGIEVDDTDVDADYDDVISNVALDSTDKQGTFRARLFNMVSGGQKVEHTGFELESGGEWEERSLIIFSAALAAGGTAHTATPTEAVGVTDDTTRVHTAERTPTEPVGVTDSTPIKQAKVRAEPVGVTDATPVKQGRVVVEPVGVTDTIAVAKTITVEITEAIGVTDTTTRVAPAVRVVTEPVGVTDATPVKQGKVVEESVGVTDDTPSKLTIAAIVTEPVGVTDTTLPVKTIRVTITESVGVTDQIPVKQGKAIVEVVGITDTTLDDLTTPGFEEVVTEPVGVTDATEVKQGTVLAETVGVTDTVLPAKSITVEIIEAVGVGDVTASAKAATVVVTESVGVGDVVARRIDWKRIVTEAVGTADVTSRDLVLLRSVVETVGVTTLVVDDLVDTTGGWWKKDPTGHTKDPTGLTKIKATDVSPW